MPFVLMAGELVMFETPPSAGENCHFRVPSLFKASKRPSLVPRNAEIFLKEGWNLVGFPHMYWDYTASDLMTQTGATRVEGFNAVAPPYYMYGLTPPMYMAPGEGYWVHVPADTMWMF